MVRKFSPKRLSRGFQTSGCCLISLVLCTCKIKPLYLSMLILQGRKKAAKIHLFWICRAAGASFDHQCPISVYCYPQISSICVQGWRRQCYPSWRNTILPPSQWGSTLWPVHRLFHATPSSGKWTVKTAMRMASLPFGIQVRNAVNWSLCHIHLSRWWMCLMYSSVRYTHPGDEFCLKVACSSVIYTHMHTCIYMTSCMYVCLCTHGVSIHTHTCTHTR